MARTSVLQALVARATVLKTNQAAILGLISSALDLPKDKPNAFVPCLMALKTYPVGSLL